MLIEQRSAERRKRMVAHVTSSFEDAERWDLEYWLSRTPEERLSAGPVRGARAAPGRLG